MKRWYNYSCVFLLTICYSSVFRECFHMTERKYIFLVSSQVNRTVSNWWNSSHLYLTNKVGVYIIIRKTRRRKFLLKKWLIGRDILRHNLWLVVVSHFNEFHHYNFYQKIFVKIFKKTIQKFLHLRIYNFYFLWVYLTSRGIWIHEKTKVKEVGM